jgi:chemotaxis protein histidine kinase CheA
MAEEKISSQISIDLTANATPALVEIAKVSQALAKLESQQQGTIRQQNVAGAAKRTLDAVIKEEELAQKRIAEMREKGLNTGADAAVEKTTARIAAAVKTLKSQLAEVWTETKLPGGGTQRTMTGGLPNLIRQAVGLEDKDIDAATKNVEKLKGLRDGAARLIESFSGTEDRPGPLATRGKLIESLEKLKEAVSPRKQSIFDEDFTSGATTSGLTKTGTQSPVIGAKGAGEGKVLSWDPSRFTPDYIEKLARLRSEGISEKRVGNNPTRADVEESFRGVARTALTPIDQAGLSSPDAIKARASAINALLAEEKVLLKREFDAGVKKVEAAKETAASSEKAAESTRRASDAKKRVVEAAKTEEKAAAEAVKPAQESAASATKTKATKAKTAEVAKIEEKASEEVAASSAATAEATKKTRASRKKTEEAAKTESVAQEAAATQRVESATKAAKNQKTTEAKAAEAARAEQQAIDALQSRVRAATKTATSRPASVLTGAGTGAVLRAANDFAKPYGPTRAELGADSAAPKSLNEVAAAANKAAAGLNSVAANTGKWHGPGRVELGAGMPPGLTPTRTARGGGGSLMSQLTAELKSPELAKASSNVHKLFRQVEAANNPKYVQGFNQISTSIFNVGGASNRASSAIQRMSESNTGFLGQIKQVAGMAASYQVLQGIATEVGQLIGHLSGGIIAFNSMIERTTVGFTTLFKNQAKSSFELAESTGKINTEMADLSGELDYIKLGYGDIDSAASGMIENIRQFANVTPFRFEELAEATLRMRAFGFSLDEVLKKTEGTATGFSGAVQTVGDAVAALGGGAPEFRRITYALGQMKQAGRVYQNDMMQLANAGIGGYKYIADALMNQISTTNDDGQRIAKKGYEGMYKELQTNAIETIRRLTTAGRISGEVASRAILQGMEKDFGGGMAAYAKTFFGALTTVADSSQSLVAEAFKPLYNAIRDTTVELAAALQTDEARTFAIQFSKYVEQGVTVLTKLGQTVTKISRLIFDDLIGAVRSFANQTRNVGGVSGSVFNLFADGLGVVTSLLENDLTRGLILTTVLMKAFSAAVSANPLLSFISLVIIGLGALRNAYETNLMGFRQYIDSVTQKWGPMIQVIQDKIIPLLNKISEVVLGTVMVAFITLFELIEPTLQGVVDVIGSLINQFEFLGPIIGAVGSGIVLAIGGAVLVSAIARLRNALGGIAFDLSKIGLEAAAAKGMLDKMTISAMQANEGALPPGQRPGFVPYGGGSGFKLMGAAMVGQMALGALTPAITGNGTDETMTAITGIANSILSVTMAVGLLKTIIPAGIGTMISGGITTLLSSLPIIGTRLAAVAASAQLVQLAMVAWPVAAVVAVGAMGVALNDFLNSQQAKEFKNYMDAMAQYAKENNAYDQYGKPIDVPTFTDEESIIANDIRKKIAWGKDPFEGQGVLGTEFLSKSKDEFGNVKKEWQAVYDKLMAIKKAQEAIRNWKVGSWGSEWVENTEKTENNVQSIYDLTGLLIDANEKLGDSQARLNFLLDLAKLKYKGALDLLQELANSILNKILNPDVRINPYTGLDQVGLQLQEVLDIQQEMSFAQFENASGTVRSFDEYRSILEAILPLSERDYELKEDGTRSDKISLKAVNERLKIEKERRKELDLIRKAAEAEYDLSIEVLKQYDESIDPLERAVSLRNAQLKYQKDIADLEFQSLENIVDQAKVSAAWQRASEITKIKMRELQKGQELILNEMRRMFEQYEQDIANIMADPRLSEAQKKNAATERLKKLMSDLETQFGITEVMLTQEIQYFNKKIDDYIATLNMSGKDLNVSWGGKWAERLEAGGFVVIKKYLNNTLKEIIRLMALIEAATVAQSQTEGEIVLKNRAWYLAQFREKLNQLDVLGLLPDVRLNLARKINQSFATSQDPNFLLTLRNLITSQLGSLFSAYNNPALRPLSFRASGGMISGGSPYLVGEGGPELIIPRSQGLVLNNSVSSRLMAMMTGRSADGGNNVIINVNNPTIRSDNDIRKLADQITRAQVSAFRTAGGRLS